MSWRDSASGSSDWHGGGDSAGNNGPSGAGTGGGNRGGGGNGGNNYSTTGGLGGGLNTSTTWHGNTAFGPAGGNAIGYATSKLGAGAGQRPTTNTYSNFRNPDGSQMFSGAAQNVAVRAPNANVAASTLAALQAQSQASAGRVGGLLSDEETTTAPIDPIDPVTVVPTMAEPWAWANPAVINPYPQWSGAGSWFAGPNYINAGANGPVWSGGFPTRQYKEDQENLNQSKGDLPDNINSIGTAYGRFY